MLTPKKRAFAQEYLIDLNATQAAVRAGYSKKTANEQGARLLADVSVRTLIEEAMKARAERTQITQDMVLNELAKIGFADIRKGGTRGGTEPRAQTRQDGETLVEPYHGLQLGAAEKVDDSTAAAIAEISQGKEGLKVKFHDKKGALVDIGRHLGMFRDKMEVTGKDGKDLVPEPKGVLVVPGIMADPSAWAAAVEKAKPKG